jgi:uncharacterized protein (DUF2235 family)
VGRNIVVCCDGTANQFAVRNTNVVKLYSTLVDDPARQHIFYHPGIGTREAPGALTNLGRWVTVKLGQVFGYGLERDIADVYASVMNSWRADDHLYLFGFSRGAYTVRAVAALLHAFGLLRAGHETSIPYAIRLLNAVAKRQPGDNEVFRLQDKFKATFSSADCRPYFVGIWDTVSSVGWIGNPLTIPYGTNNPSIQIGRHAVSIDEHRAFYRQNLWRPNPDPARPSGPRDVKQVWFAGVHCDVGGGYADAESGLSKIALRWMLEEAEGKGLLVDPVRRSAVLAESQGPDPNAKMHDELVAHPWWWLAEIVPKRHYDSTTHKKDWQLNLGRHRTMPEGSIVHESVLKRAGYSPRLPPGYKVELDSQPAAQPASTASPTI